MKGFIAGITEYQRFMNYFVSSNGIQELNPNFNKNVKVQLKIMNFSKFILSANKIYDIWTFVGITIRWLEKYLIKTIKQMN